MQRNFESLNVMGEKYFIHVKTSTLVSSNSILGAVIENGDGGLRSDILDACLPELTAAVQQYMALMEMKIPSIPDSGMLISQIAISPTLSCNLNCAYCYNYQEAAPEKIRNLPSLDFESRKKIFSTLNEMPLNNELTFGFLGGEPFLNLPLINVIVEDAKSFCKDRNIRPGFLVTTNGITLKKPSVERFIIENRVGVYISIDGPKIWHDEYRKTIGGIGSYDLLTKSIERFFAYNPLRYRSARATVRLIPGRIIGTYRHLRDMGFNDIGWGSADFESANLSMIEKELIFSEIEELGNEFESDIRSERVFRHSWFTEIFSLLYSGASKQSVCGATRNHVGFDINGRMQPCHRYFGNDEFELLPDDIKIGSNSILISEIRGSGITPDCHKCWARGLCGGECFHVGRVMSRASDQVARQRFTCDFKRKKYKVAISAYENLWRDDPNIIHKMFS